MHKPGTKRIGYHAECSNIHHIDAIWVQNSHDDAIGQENIHAQLEFKLL